VSCAPVIIVSASSMTATPHLHARPCHMRGAVHGFYCRASSPILSVLGLPLPLPLPSSTNHTILPRPRIGGCFYPGSRLPNPSRLPSIPSLSPPSSALPLQLSRQVTSSWVSVPVPLWLCFWIRLFFMVTLPFFAPGTVLFC